jgi:fructose-bisphosphate aldolase, class II
MDPLDAVQRAAQPLGDAVRVAAGPLVTIANADALRQRIGALVESAVFGNEPHRSLARWLIRELAIAAGAPPASIQDLYLARGQGKTRDSFTVPAMNLRALPYHAAGAVFRAAHKVQAKALIFELARSEMGYTDQRPAEYAACILGAAIAEGHQGPVFIQGDHFQTNAKKYASEPAEEIQAIRNLIREAISAGFYNIDIDTSTLVDLSKPTIPEQQKVNTELCAEFTAHVRSLQPEGVVISVGGEIGEVGGHNSTEPELRAFMDGFNQALKTRAPRAPGLSKISIQTGTSHGGVVLPDGTIAKVKVDFDTLSRLSKVAKDYGMGGAVQHGASTLPEEAFSKFAEAGALEVHLATNFQNMLYDRLPPELLKEIYAYLDKNHSDERKENQTDEQFYYGARKRALGPYKKSFWQLPAPSLKSIEDAWQRQFELLFDRLAVGGTQVEVDRFVRPVPVRVPLADYLHEAGVAEDVKDLAD